MGSVRQDAVVSIACFARSAGDGRGTRSADPPFCSHCLGDLRQNSMQPGGGGLLRVSAAGSLAHSRLAQRDREAERRPQVRAGSGGSGLIQEVIPFNASLLPFPLASR